MGFQAEFPLAFLLLLPWLLYIVWMFKMTLRLRGRRKIMSIVTRSIILLLLIAIAAQVQPFIEREQRSLVFVADRSESMRADKRIGKWINEAWTAKEEADRGGIISSGLNAAVERTVTNEELAGDTEFNFQANVNRNYTDLSQGLQLAGAMLQKEGGGHIVLLSDGAENTGDVLRQARMLKNAGISVDVVDINTSVVTDTSIEELNVPAALKQGRPLPLRLPLTVQLRVRHSFVSMQMMLSSQFRISSLKEAKIVIRCKALRWTPAFTVLELKYLRQAMNSRQIILHMPLAG